jgi:hypothetical protein
MSWRPEIQTGVWVGLAIILVLVLMDAGLVWRVVRGPVNGVTFVCGFTVLVSLAAIALVAYRVYDLGRLRYEFDRNRFLVARAGIEYVVPLRSIERVTEVGPSGLSARIKSLRWPGCYIGPGEVDGIGLTLFHGVTPPKDQLLLVTPVLAYGISVPDLDAFRQVFTACRQLGSSAEVAHESRRAPYLHWPVWRDRVAQGLVSAGILLGALLFAVLLFRYPGLPDRLPLHYDATGQVDRIAARSEAFVLPVIGLIAWATNGVLGTLFYRRQPMLSYLAWSGTLIVQTLFLMALWDLVN